MNFFDWHCDTLSKLVNGEGAFITRKSLSFFENAVQTFAIYTPDRLDAESAYNNAKCQLAAFAKKAYPNSILSVENCKMLVNGGKTLEKFNRAGVFLFSLTHNGENQFAHGCASNGGIKPQGRELLRVAEELSMVLDVSHLSREGFFEVIDTYKGKIIASHSCFDSICPHRRNLTDEMARAIFNRGGIIGVNIYPPFLGNNSIDAVARHLEHAAELGGETQIAFGCDFDGADFLPREIEKYEDIAKISHLLAKKGFSGEQISGIFYDNSYNFLRENDCLGFLQYQKLKA